VAVADRNVSVLRNIDSHEHRPVCSTSHSAQRFRSIRGIPVKAKLAGSDGYSPPPKQFGSAAVAVSWIEGDGLAEFEGDEVRGEISNADGKIIWTKSHLQTREQLERQEKAKAHQLLARLGLTFKMGR
jgi:hypothetical protein